MQHDDMSRELFALEQKFWNAIRNRGGATADVDLKVFDASVRGRRAGQWVCVAHTGSLAEAPCGRH